MLPKPDISIFIKYLIENKYKLINEKFQVYNQKSAILIQNHRSEWYCSYIQEKNYLTSIIVNLAQIYSLELRDINKPFIVFIILCVNMFSLLNFLTD